SKAHRTAVTQFGRDEMRRGVATFRLDVPEWARHRDDTNRIPAGFQIAIREPTLRRQERCTVRSRETQKDVKRADISSLICAKEHRAISGSCRICVERRLCTAERSMIRDVRNIESRAAMPRAVFLG